MACAGGCSLGDRIANDISASWKKLPCIFPCGEGHVSCALNTTAYAFGGVTEDGQAQKLRESNDLFELDPDSSHPSWTKLDVNGSLPPPRSGAALAAVDDKLYLFGGLSHAFGWFDDLHMFDIGTNIWSVLNYEGHRPTGRDKLQCVVIDRRIIYFGGFGPKPADPDLEDDEDAREQIVDQEGQQFGWFDDLFILDTERRKWSQPVHMNLAVPTSRAAHIMCAVGRNIYIFGGRDVEARQNDLHVFNIDTRKWDTGFKVKGRTPEARSFHAAVTVGNRIVIMGGRGLRNQHFSDMHILDIETKQWLQPAIIGDVPAARGQHSAVVADGFIVLNGGSGNFSEETMQCHNHYSDTYILKTGDLFNKVVM